MKLVMVLAVAVSILMATVPAFSQQASPGWYRVWSIASATPGPGVPPDPKMSRLISSEKGWVYAGLNSDGALRVYGIAYGPNNGCIPLGWPAGYTCTSKFADPMHYDWTVLNKGATVGVHKCELSADKKTFKESLTVTPADGKQVSYELTWAIVPPPVPAKKAPAPKK
jgi:hypothetical protein